MLISLFRNAIILLCCLLVIPPAFSSSSSTFSHIFVFGDSLSDTGNFASINGPFPNPPFFNNRVSNGLTTIDALAQELGLSVDASLHLIGPAIGTNFAVVGARAAGQTAIDLPAQISAFSLTQGGFAPVDALYVVFIGGNDVRDARDTVDQNLAEQLIVNAVNGEVEQIQSLIDLGAKNILVVDVANIGAIPETNLIAAQLNSNQFALRATQFSRQYNRELKYLLKELMRQNNKDVELVRFNYFDELEELVEEASGLGFINTTDACFSTVNLSFNPSCNFGANFDQFIFFDEIHPTARTNAIIGDELFEEIEEFADEDD